MIYGRANLTRAFFSSDSNLINAAIKTHRKAKIGDGLITLSVRQGVHKKVDAIPYL